MKGDHHHRHHRLSFGFSPTGIERGYYSYGYPDYSYDYYDYYLPGQRVLLGPSESANIQC